MPYKSENPESLKKWSQQFESFSTNASIAGEYLLRAIYRAFFIYNFVIQVISEKTLSSKGFTSNFYMKIIVTIILTDQIQICFYPTLCPFLQNKNKNLVFSKLVVWWRKIFLFVVYSESRFPSKPCWIQ